VEEMNEIPTLILEGPLDQISENDIESRLESEFGCHVSKVTMDRNQMRSFVEFGSEEDLKKIVSSNTQNEIKIRGKTVRLDVILHYHFSYHSFFYLIFCIMTHTSHLMVKLKLSLSSTSEQKDRKKHLYGLPLNCTVDAIKFALNFRGINQIENVVFDSESCSSTITISNIEECNKLPPSILIQGIQVSYLFNQIPFVVYVKKNVFF
jgi:hypothetical protein